MVSAVIVAALLCGMVFVLGLHVSLQRMKSDVFTGQQDDPTSALNKAVRAHGNTAEFAPAMAVLILYLGTQTPAFWVEIVFCLALASRVSIALGILVCPSLARAHPLKMIGSTGTYITGPILAVLAILTVV